MHYSTGRKTSVFYTTLADQETQYITAAHTFPLKRFTIGLGLAQRQSPNLDFTQHNELTNRTYSESTFEANDRLYRVAISGTLYKGLSIGAATHYYSSTAHNYKGSGANGDFGLAFQSKRFALSANFKNIARVSKISYNQGISSAKFPTRFSFSGKVKALSYATLYAQINYYMKQTLFTRSLALELSSKKILQSNANLYIGYNQAYVSGLVKPRLTAGIGLNVTRLKFQFVYSHTPKSLETDLFGFSISL